MQILQSLRTGDVVVVRRRKWRVVEIRAFEECSVVALSGRSDEPAAIVRRVIAPFDTVETLARRDRPRLVTMARWRRACRALLTRTSPPGGLRAACRARIDLLPHQLEPALAIVRGLGARLLLADDVGLGKTIQAGLVLAELRDRALADRALIVTPASVRDQWAGELADRFGMRAIVFDAREVHRRAAELPSGVNPWSTEPLVIASIEYVKRPETLVAIDACRWDLLIVDEAHTTAGESERHAAVSMIARRCAYVLLLTATPHNGDVRAFNSLCATGAHGEACEGGADPVLVFRRTRRDISTIAQRRVHRLFVRPSESEQRMHALVLEVGRAAASTSSGSIWLALAVLNKRALSSAQSLLHTVERRLAALDANATPGSSERPVSLPFWDPDDEEDDGMDEGDRAPEMPGLSFSDPERERVLLRRVADAARVAAANESKLRTLVRLLQRLREPAIVFTEYRDTLFHIHRTIGQPAALLHGGLTRRERAAALDDFLSGRQRLLLATDAAGVGLNLQQRCRTVINLELPWNPMRLEQRIGRVDRIGQVRKVHAFHLIAAGTPEERILDRLRHRLARASADFAAPDPIGLGSDSSDLTRRSDDEGEVARWLVNDTPTESGSGGNTANLAPADRTPVDRTHRVIRLRPDAEREVVRLTRSRRFTVAGDDEVLAALDAGGTWLAFDRRQRVRRTLGEGLLCVFGVELDDRSGRRVESTLVPVHVRFISGDYGMHRGRIERALAARDGDIRDRIESHTDTWRSDAATSWHALIETRLRRESAVARLAVMPDTLLQPGLFDRRAERVQAIARMSAEDAAAEATRRVAVYPNARELAAAAPRLLLVLAL